MHDIKTIRENPNLFQDCMGKRGVSVSVDEILSLDTLYRQHVTDLQNLQSKRNLLAKQYATLKKEGSNTESLTTESQILGEKITALESQSETVQKNLQSILENLPNIPSEDCPVGKDETQNVEIKRYGEPRVFDFEAKQHFELGESLGLMDFQTAAYLSGARFVVLKSQLALLERALGNFMLDIHTQEFGYEEINVPVLVQSPALYGVGHLPKFARDMFQTTSQHWLISTAEAALTNLVAQKIVQEESLPLRFTALTPCFRSEAGSAGRDTRGMIRQHQFSKVELVSVALPSQSISEHEYMTRAAETILERLELPYRRLLLCTGDMGFSSEKTYDLEVWLPGQKTYREISSCSRCHAFQARRMNARYKSKEDGKNHFLHTLNGSGLAVGRTLVAILENYQQEDGSIMVPEKLIPYMRGLKKITMSRA